MTKLPLICQGCGHVVVIDGDRVDAQGVPRHECAAAGRGTVFVPHESCEQAAGSLRRLSGDRRVSLL